jgi:hypothetical protein
MNCYEKWSIGTNIFIAIGTISSVLAAIFGEKIRYWFNKPKLSIEILDAKGELTRWNNGVRVYYYHLVFKNLKPGRTIKKCSVFLKKMQRLEFDGNFIDISISVPPRYIWAPAEKERESLDIISEQVLDFGYLTEHYNTQQPNYFVPCLESQPNNLNVLVFEKETVRYHLEVISENYTQKRLIIVEFSWNGEWTENIDEMQKNFSFKIV